jgi:hypothetical protein
MTKSTSKVLNKAIKSLIDRLEKTEKFAIDQAPDVCKQMVSEYKIDVYLGMAAPLFAMLIAGIIVAMAMHKGLYEIREAGTQWEHTVSGDWMVGYVIGIIVIIGSFVPLAINLRNLWFIIYCPKLFLLREFRRLVR